MNELKSILSQWLLYNYTTFKTSTFWKLSLKHTTLGFLFITGLPSHEWNEIHPSTMNTVEVYHCKNFHYLKRKFRNHTTLRFPFIRGWSSLMNQINSILLRWLLSNYTTVKTFTTWRVTLESIQLWVPVYQGSSLPWMKWNPSFHNDYCLTILLSKLSLPEK